MKKRASASLPQSLYRRQDLAAAAAAFSGRAEIRLRGEGRRWRLEAQAVDGVDARLLLADFLNEALLRGLRSARLREAGALAAAVAGRLLERGFPSEPADPLEQMEPQVRADRARDAEALLERARSLR